MYFWSNKHGLVEHKRLLSNIFLKKNYRIDRVWGCFILLSTLYGPFKHSVSKHEGRPLECVSVCAQDRSGLVGPAASWFPSAAIRPTASNNSIHSQPELKSLTHTLMCHASGFLSGHMKTLHLKCTEHIRAKDQHLGLKWLLTHGRLILNAILRSASYKTILRLVSKVFHTARQLSKAFAQKHSTCGMVNMGCLWFLTYLQRVFHSPHSIELLATLELIRAAIGQTGV